jgi:hypothetical protein
MFICVRLQCLPLCRRYVGGDPARFERLITEQLTPAQLDSDPPEGRS